ncbi:hypothetical protein TREMEDRAFT_58624 [Tremella mesenterica DSM 1558]|uniref:uncharacterized protein n=1 Tax=Tremella mesenterica (strain ATCC 24925 / CBS 8224 / DSM 1558 / NBRC 9311 / NRRL Y-6157 / RJB 2259-6 / UBC 559-6) TaxID=578456 RepID=UPI0003F4A083|nr:uncharacterized protein TREMEDRAFT_58624 [Tremella mesenterica DSM 1558]EIW72460.1 hypothetical protein TREMEDRAFT_58624 [Tremella mesenterica DSM 1558]
MSTIDNDAPTDPSTVPETTNSGEAAGEETETKPTRSRRPSVDAEDLTRRLERLSTPSRTLNNFSGVPPSWLYPPPVTHIPGRSSPNVPFTWIRQGPHGWWGPSYPTIPHGYMMCPDGSYLIPSPYGMVPSDIGGYTLRSPPIEGYMSQWSGLPSPRYPGNRPQSLIQPSPHFLPPVTSPSIPYPAQGYVELLTRYEEIRGHSDVYAESYPNSEDETGGDTRMSNTDRHRTGTGNRLPRMRERPDHPHISSHESNVATLGSRVPGQHRRRNRRLSVSTNHEQAPGRGETRLNNNSQTDGQTSSGRRTTHVEVVRNGVVIAEEDLEEGENLTLGQDTMKRLSSQYVSYGARQVRCGPDETSLVRQAASKVYGPLVIGNFLSCWLYGVFIMLFHLYFRLCKKDKTLNRCVVLVLFVLTTLDTTFHAIRTVLLTASHPGDVEYFQMLNKRFEDWAGLLTSNLTATFSQAFMAYRIISFARAMRPTYGPRTTLLIRILGIILSGGILLSLGSGMALPLYLRTKHTYHEVSRRSGDLIFPCLTSLQLGSFLGLDVMITILMTLELRLARTGFAASNGILDVLVALIVKNCLLVTALQTAQLICYWKTYTTWSEFSPIFIGKVYAITVLGILCEPRVAHQVYLHKLDTEAIPDLGISSISQTMTSITICNSCGYPSSPTPSSSPRLENTSDCHCQHRNMYDTGGSPISVGMNKSPTMQDGLIGFRAALLGLEEGELRVEVHDTPRLEMDRISQEGDLRVEESQV